MRINIDRICELAGIAGARKTRGGLLRESHDMYEENQLPDDLMNALPEGDEEEDEEEQDEANEIVEIDEADLVKELRRIRLKTIKENNIRLKRKQALQESQLKAVIDQEVKNVLRELNLNSGWVYGNKKPTRSRKGYTHQGSFLKGIGFR